MTFQWHLPHIYSGNRKRCTSEPYSNFFMKNEFPQVQQKAFCEHESFLGESLVSQFGGHISDPYKFMLTPCLSSTMRMYVTSKSHKFAIGVLTEDKSTHLPSIPDLLKHKKERGPIDELLRIMQNLVESTGGYMWMGLDFKMITGTNELTITYPYKGQHFWNVANRLTNLVYDQADTRYKLCETKKALNWAQCIDEELDALKDSTIQRYMDMSNGSYVPRDLYESPIRPLVTHYLRMAYEDRERFGFNEADQALTAVVKGFCSKYGLTIGEEKGDRNRVQNLVNMLDLG